MRVLVACEESQRVCIAFREKGHEAYSCDIQPCSGGHPEWHIQGDVLPMLSEKWDLLIAHPPCTYLSNVSAPRLFPHGELCESRYKKALESREFFFKFINADVPHICVENPMPLAIMKLPKPDCIIEPWQFGEPYSKRTYLWLKGLPPLIPTNVVKSHIIPWVNSSGGKLRKGQHGVANSKKERSKTFWGIARAMAEQWGGIS